MDATVSVKTAETAGLDEDQRPDDELVVLPLLSASGVKQKCRHADSSRGRVPQWNDCGYAPRPRGDCCYIEMRLASTTVKAAEAGTWAAIPGDPIDSSRHGATDTARESVGQPFRRSVDGPPVDRPVDRNPYMRADACGSMRNVPPECCRADLALVLEIRRICGRYRKRGTEESNLALRFWRPLCSGGDTVAVNPGVVGFVDGLAEPISEMRPAPKRRRKRAPARP
jgi:hypothetical protein